MRTKEIQVGVEYAIAGYGVEDNTRNRRVRVIEIGVPREVYARGAFRPHMSRDGVLVEHLEADGTTRMRRRVVGRTEKIVEYRLFELPRTEMVEEVEEIPMRDVVRPAQVFRTWDDQVKSNELAHDYAMQREASKNLRKAAQANAAARVNALLDRKALDSWNMRDDGSVNINVKDLAALLEMIPSN